MKRNYIILLSLEIIFLLLLLFNIFISSIFTYTNMNYILLWGISLVALTAILGFEKDKHLYKLDVLQLVFIYTVTYLIFTYVLGLFFGFMKSPYSSDFVNIVKNIFPVLLVLICQELVRYIIIAKSKEKKIFIIFLIMLFSIFDIALGISGYNLKIPMEIFEFVANLVLPSIIINSLLSYISYHSGYKPTIMYRLILEVTIYLLPLFPDIGIYIKSILEIIFPLIIFLGINGFYSKIQISMLRNNKFAKLMFWIPVTTLLLSMVVLTSGLFKVFSLAIGSGSMEPNINKGDAVIIEKLTEEDIENLKVDDIIVYSKDQKVVVHRILSISYENGGMIFQTKGDNNSDSDNYKVEKREVKGLVRLKIPYIGYPAVWLSELSK